jgi:hypothetical protein
MADRGIGNGYLLRGQWKLGKDETKNLFEQLYFQGVLEGHHFEALGYQFQKLEAEARGSPTEIDFKNIIVTDPCGLLQSAEMRLNKISDTDWLLHLPLLTVSNFRPSLLHQVRAAAPYVIKPLIVQQVELEGFRGIVGDRDSFCGKGFLSFTNSSKRNQSNILFAIPSEILSRIGLDLGVLNPASGMIFYEIKGAKVHLSRFKDIYSEGRLSKFYLPNTAYESYMDFSGNLHIQVRMKQYNLLFKLAELFTVTIQGSLKKPTYTLQKQNHQAANPKEIVLDKS